MLSYYLIKKFASKYAVELTIFEVSWYGSEALTLIHWIELKCEEMFIRKKFYKTYLYIWSTIAVNYDLSPSRVITRDQNIPKWSPFAWTNMNSSYRIVLLRLWARSTNKRLHLHLLLLFLISFWFSCARVASERIFIVKKKEALFRSLFVPLLQHCILVSAIQ